MNDAEAPFEMVELGSLGHLMRARRMSLGLSLRDLEEQLARELTASSLSRIENGAIPDPKNVSLIAHWLDIPLNRVAWPGETSGPSIGETTPDVIEVHLRADKNLNPAAAEALGLMFRRLYDDFAGDQMLQGLVADSSR